MTTTREAIVSRGRTRAPGAITSAMRAVPGDGKRIARIARVEQGRIVDEWLSRKEAKLAGGALRRKNDGYELELDVGVSARVATDQGVQLVTGPCRVPLSDDARGKVIAGSVTHLFQLVLEAPRTKAQLPVSAVAHGAGIDWRFAIVVAISLLGHFGFASAASADWFDPVVDEDRETVALITEAKSRPELPIEEPKTPEPGEKPSDVKPTTNVAKAAPEPGKGAPSPVKKNAGSDLSALGKQLDELGLATIASLDPKSGPAPSKLLKDPSAADGALDELAKKQGGVEPDGPKLKGDPGGVGPIAKGDNGIVFGDTKGNTPKGDDKPKLEEPKAPVKVNDPVISSPALPSDVNNVIAKNRWKLRACYTKELVTNSDAQGTVYATVTISMEGDVIASDATSSMSPSMNKCVAGAFASMHFAPSEGKSTIKVPVIYTKPG